MKRAFALFFLLSSLPIFAQDRVAAAIDSLPSIKRIDQVVISPDGTQVAYIYSDQLWVASVNDAVPHRVAPEQKLAQREVTWSSDSRHLAWLADLPGDTPGSEMWPADGDG